MKNRISKTFISIGLFIVSINAQSALSPTSLKLRDLDTLVSFIEQHERVADTLEHIDLINYRVVFDGGCEAHFVRVKKSLLKMSMPGPQPDIELESSSCGLSYDRKE